MFELLIQQQNTTTGTGGNCEKEKQLAKKT